VQTLQRGLLQVKGVEDATSDPGSKTMTVIYAPSRISATAIRDKIGQLGHRPT
jgi:hypothetical protein